MDEQRVLWGSQGDLIIIDWAGHGGQSHPRHITF